MNKPKYELKTRVVVTLPKGERFSGSVIGFESAANLNPEEAKRHQLDYPVSCRTGWLYHVKRDDGQFRYSIVPESTITPEL